MKRNITHYFLAPALILVVLVYVGLVFDTGVVCAVHSGREGGCGNEHGSLDGSRGSDGPVAPITPPLYLPTCVISTDPMIVEKGKPTPITIFGRIYYVASRSISYAITGQGGAIITSGTGSIPDTFRVSTTVTASSPFRYSALEIRPGDSSYTSICSVPLAVVDKFTECNDTRDNGDLEDTLVDLLDSGCKNPDDVSENDEKPNLSASLSAPTKVVLNTNLSFTGAIKNSNDAPVYVLSSRKLLWRQIGVPAGTTVIDGMRYHQLFGGVGTYALNALWENTAKFVPRVEGTYEVCVAADSDNAIIETNEKDNLACKEVKVEKGSTVTPTPPPPPGGVITPVTLDVEQPRVRKGGTTTLIFNTGGRKECTIMGTNNQTILPSTFTGSVSTTEINAPTVYRLSCPDGAYDEVVVKLIPQLMEI